MHSARERARSRPYDWRDFPLAAVDRGRAMAALWLLRFLSSTAVADRQLLLGAGVALLLNVAAYLYVVSVLDQLPQLMPLHYNGSGVVDLIGHPIELLKLPAIGTAILLANAVLALALHPRERPAAHFLIWTALAVQIIFGTGAWVLVTKAAGE